MVGLNGYSLRRSLLPRSRDFTLRTPPPRDVLQAKLFINDAAAAAFKAIRSRPAASPTEKLYWATRLVRAARRGDTYSIRTAITAWPDLESHVEPDLSRPTPSLQALTRELVEEIYAHELASPPPSGADREQRLQASLAHFKIWKKACSRVSFSGILVPSADNEPALPVTGAAAAEALAAHWAPVFKAKVVHPDAEETLLRHIPAAQFPRTSLSGIDFATESLTQHRNSSPGPDGIRYIAWVAAGPPFVQTLTDYWDALLEGGTFNDDDRRGLTCFPPKGDDPPRYVPPSDTRPITLMNTSYKFVMGQANTLIAAVIPDHLDDRQKGFIRGRLGIEHVLSLEAAAYALSHLGGPALAILLLDIQAAFPSVSHSFIRKAIRKFGGDHPVVNIIIDSLSGAYTDILMNGDIFPGFHITAGIRQGCPASGSVFVIVFHAVLVELSVSGDLGRLTKEHRLFIFAYADDLALVAANIWEVLKPLETCFLLVERGLHTNLNIKKSVAIPIARSAKNFEIKRRIVDNYPFWQSIAVENSAKYFGIIIGPEVTPTARWAPTTHKYLQRSHVLARLGLGWTTAIRLHNAVVTSLLSHVGQVAFLPEDFHNIIPTVIARLLRAPYNRIPPELAYNLHVVSLPARMTDPFCSNLSAMARVALQSASVLREIFAFIVHAKAQDDCLFVDPYPEWGKSLLATQVRSALATVNSRAAEQFTIYHSHTQRKITEALGAAQAFSPARFVEQFSQRLVPVFARHTLPFSTVDFAKHLVWIITVATSKLPAACIYPIFRFGCNAWQLSSPQGADEHICRLCRLQASPGQHHLVSCPGFLALPGSLPGVVWPFLEGPPAFARIFAFSDPPVAENALAATVWLDALWAALSGPPASPERAMRARVRALAARSPAYAAVARPLLGS